MKALIEGSHRWVQALLLGGGALVVGAVLFEPGTAQAQDSVSCTAQQHFFPPYDTFYHSCVANLGAGATIQSWFFREDYNNDGVFSNQETTTTTVTSGFYLHFCTVGSERTRWIYVAYRYPGDTSDRYKARKVICEGWVD